MDEPTSALSTTRSEVLSLGEDLTAQAAWPIIYISHKLDEFLRIGDYFTVLRDGRLVARVDCPK